MSILKVHIPSSSGLATPLLGSISLQYIIRQHKGPKPTRDYNERMQEILDTRVNPEKVEFSDGGWTAVDWYNITDGGYAD